LEFNFQIRQSELFQQHVLVAQVDELFTYLTGIILQTQDVAAKVDLFNNVMP
jgi:hypothetical protein